LCCIILIHTWQLLATQLPLFIKAMAAACDAYPAAADASAGACSECYCCLLWCDFSVQAFGWMLATLLLLCHLHGWGLFLLFATARVATSVSS
jgi:hypothetical protein